MGDQPYIHEKAVVDSGAKVGAGTRIWHFCHIMSSAVIGKNCNIGQNVFIGKAVVGDGCKIQNNVSLYDGVILEKNVFCGPSMVFTNVFNPRAHVERKDQFLETLVKQGATIGANATILCGNTLGAYCLIGAGAVVTRDVPDFAVMTGNPAKQSGWACQCGELLALENARAKCECGKSYRLIDEQELVRD